ncbi:unnamed protein product [Rhodiola kirilowii]
MIKSLSREKISFSSCCLN